MTSQIPKNQNCNAFTKVLLLRYNHNHGTHMYNCPLKGKKTSVYIVQDMKPEGERHNEMQNTLYLLSFVRKFFLAECNKI